MEKLMNNIENKIDELFNDFQKQDIYKKYLSVKDKLKNNKEIMNLINEIKRIQKILANNKDYTLQKELKKLYDKLNNYPLYQSYMIIKDDVEQSLYEIKEQFEKYFNEILKINL